VAGVGLVGRSGNLRPAPIASVTKVMTAYTILRDHPLAAGQDGPRIRVLRSEAAAYARRRAAGESLVKVSASRPVTERQALQALLIASGNNMADILARWDAGSTRAFVRRMNADAALLGMTSTHYADASGLNPASRSTTADLVRLARAAMAGDTFAAIVRQQRASIPLNQLRNTNKLLGRHGIIGIKTGSTRAAGGCLLFAAHRVVGGRVYTVYGALLGAPGPKILTHALAASDALVVAARAALVPATVLRAGQRVATVRKADGTVVSLALGRNLDVVGWAGQTYRLSLPRGLPPGQVPTTLTARTPARTLTVPLVTAT
jgi:D-alanyl-D-alanine carboxypeptidase (penicillin-binding protein 5/6)